MIPDQSLVSLVVIIQKKEIALACIHGREPLRVLEKREGKKKRHTNLVEHKFGQSCGILRRGSNAQLLALFSSDLLDRVPDS